MTRPLMSDAELRHRKKIQGNLSVVGGTLGLAALGARGGATAYAGKRAGKLLKIAGNPQREQKLKDISTGLTTGGAGLGGVGAYNFAAYTKAESRKRGYGQPVRKAGEVGGVVAPNNQRKVETGNRVKKSWEAPMDFGLSGVHQGENISKALTRRERDEVNDAGTKAIIPGAAAGYATYKGGRAARASKWGYQMSRDLGSSKGGAVKAGARLIPVAAKARGVYSVPAALGGGYAAALGVAHHKTRQIEQRKELGKASDWMNITEHQRRARDSRRTQRRASTVAGLGYTVGAGAAGLAMTRGRNPLKEASNVARSTKVVGEAAWKMRGVKGPLASSARKGNLKALKGVVRRNGYGATALGGGAVMTGGLATAAGARVNEKRHDRAIAHQRRQRAVTKAYDPERNRQRRLDVYSTGAAAGSGAAGVAAIHTGRKAVGHPAREAWKTRGNTSTKIMRRGTGLYGSGNEVRGSLKGLGKAGALGLTAVGLGVGADRIKSYQKGRGRRYTPLH